MIDFADRAEALERFVALDPSIGSAERQRACDAPFQRYGRIARLLGPGVRASVSVNDRVGGGLGFLGDLVLSEDVAVTEALLNRAFDWLREGGCTRVQTDITRHTWYPFRIVTGGLDGMSRLSGEPWNPPWLADRLAEAGFSPVAWYVSVLSEDSTPQIAKGSPRIAALQAEGYRFRAFDPQHAVRDLAALHDLTLRAFAPPVNHLFHPIDFEEFVVVMGPASGKLDPRLVWLCEAPDGVVAGYVYTSAEGPDLACLKTLAVGREFQRLGIAAALTALTHQAARDTGRRRMVHALMRTEGPSKGLSDAGANAPFRRYAVFERSL